MKIQFILFLLVVSLLLSCSSAESDTTDSGTPTDNRLEHSTKKPSGNEDPQPTLTMDDEEVPSDNPSLESAIKKIRTQFQETESSNASLTQKTVRGHEFEDYEITSAIGYYDAEGKPKKITMEKAIGHSGSLTTYYIKDGVPYFIYEQASHEASLRGPYTYEEKRIYIDGGQIIRQLEKAKTVEGDTDPEMPKVPNKDVTETLENTSAEEYASLVQQLIGILSRYSDTLDETRWVSEDDNQSVIEMKYGVWNDYYDGKIVSSGTYKMEKKEDAQYVTVTNNEGTTEYIIIKQTDSELQIAMVGGRGNTLAYKKENK